MPSRALQLGEFSTSRLGFIFHRDLSVGEARALQFESRAMAFADFVERRLLTSRRWPERLHRLSLVVSNERDDDRDADVALVPAELSGNETDEELVAVLAATFNAPLERRVPGARLLVLADEFLDGGCVSVVPSSLVAANGVSAHLVFRLAMRMFEASLEVRSKAGTLRHLVLTSGPDETWWSLFGSLSVNARTVVLRAVSASLFVRDTGKRRYLFATGTGRKVRRYTIDVARDGEQSLVQKWELTGKGGKPVAGSGLLTRNALR